MLNDVALEKKKYLIVFRVCNEFLKLNLRLARNTVYEHYTTHCGVFDIKIESIIF